MSKRNHKKITKHKARLKARKLHEQQQQNGQMKKSINNMMHEMRTSLYNDIINVFSPNQIFKDCKYINENGAWTRGSLKIILPIKNEELTWEDQVTVLENKKPIKLAILKDIVNDIFAVTELDEYQTLITCYAASGKINQERLAFQQTYMLNDFMSEYGHKL